jgi:hypothetical protein
MRRTTDTPWGTPGARLSRRACLRRLTAAGPGVVAASALGRFRFGGRTPVLYLVLSMTMFPQIAVLGSLYALITALGLYNTLGALGLTHLIFTLPFTVWVLTGFFQASPADLEEAAKVDDATPVGAPPLWGRGIRSVISPPARSCRAGRSARVDQALPRPTALELQLLRRAPRDTAGAVETCWVGEVLRGGLAAPRPRRAAPPEFRIK